MIPTTIQIGKRIRLARLSAELSQGKLGEKLDPPRTHMAVSLMERGDSKVFLVDILKMCEILGRPLEYFIGSSNGEM